MKHLSLSTVLLTCLALLFVSRATAQTPKQAPLTNSSVVKLAKAGFKEKTIIAIIGSRLVRFDLSTDGLVELKRNSVSERVILAMLQQQEGIAFKDDDDFGEESFFGHDNDLTRSLPGQNSGDKTGNRADIFGSSGGSRNETKTRGGSAGSSGDTITNGSATVRILRPPVEAGAPPKLDKAPTLTNASIVELVNGGFSEGTIIRRIEQSPVDFDLSPDKLAELRKHDVSEKLLTAMKLAMGDSGETQTPAKTKN